MANSLMFEVGVKDAKGQLEALENRLKRITDKYGSLKLKVEVDNLQKFITALETIGKGQQLEPLLRRIDLLQASLANIGTQGANSLREFETAVKTNTAVADQYRKRIEELTIARDKFASTSDAYKRADLKLNNFREDKTTMAILAQEQLAIKNLADAQAHLSNEEKKGGASANDLQSQIQKLSTAIDGLSKKTFSVNMGTEFKTWAEQVQGLTTRIKELVAQLERLGTKTGTSGMENMGQNFAMLNTSITMLTENMAKFILEMQKLNALPTPKIANIAEQPARQGGLFDTKNILTLQEAIDKVISEIVRLKEAFAGIGHIEGLTTLTTEINGLMHNVNNLKDTLSTLSSAVKLSGSKEEIEAWEKKVAALKAQYEQLATQQTATAQAAQSTAKGGKEQTDETEKQVNNYIRQMKLLAAIENQMVAIGRIQAQGEKSGFAPTLLKQAYNALEALQKMFYANGKMDKMIPLKGSEISMIQQSLGALRTEYKDIIAEADRFNKSNDKTGTILAESARKASIEYHNLESMIKQVDNLIARGTTAHINIDELRNARHFLTVLQNDMRAISSSGGSVQGTTTKSLLNQDNVVNGLHAAKEAVSAFGKELTVAEGNMKQAGKEADKLTVTISNLEALRDKARNMGVDTTQLESVINRIRQYEQALRDVQKTNSTGTKNITLHEGFLQMKRDIKDVASAIQKSMNDAMKPNNPLANSYKEYASILRQIASLSKTATTAESFGIDTVKLRQQITELERYSAILERIIKNNGQGFDSVKNSIDYNNARNNPVIEQARINAKVAEEKNKNASATSRLANEEVKLSTALSQSNSHMKNQSQLLGDLKMMATQYLSLWGMQGFINKIIETGGLLEQQRLSLSAILGDMDKANELFGQVKALAVKSPFGVVQIDQMTKQLAAYGFEYEELFDWTKRLGDISAATGTEVSRLALALGHVRSEGALSGYTLRQFSMGNVPLLKMLSESRGVSTKEIRDLVRKKEISDKEVQKVLMQLTDEGGMFYNAQEVMSEALNAKFKNLRDTFDIMYSEIAESAVGDMLKGLALTLTEVAKKWKVVGSVMLSMGAMFATARMATALYNAAINKGTASTLKSALADKKKNANLLRLASTYRTLTLAEKSVINTSNRLNASDIRLLLTEKKLTTEELLRAVAMGKLSKQSAILAVQSMKLGTAQKSLLLSQLQSIQHTRRWAMTMVALGNAIRSAGAAMMSFGKMILPMAAISAVMGLITARSQAKEQAHDTANLQADKLLAQYKEANNLMNQLTEKNPRGSEERQEAIKQMVETLKGIGRYTPDLEEFIDGTASLTDKYIALHKVLKDVSYEYLHMRQNLVAYLELANDSGGDSFLGIKTADNIMEDAQDLTKRSAEIAKAELELNKNSAAAASILIDFYKERGTYTNDMYDKDWKDLYRMMDSDEDRKRFYHYVETIHHKGGNEHFQAATAAMMNDLFGSYREALEDYWDDMEEIAQNDIPAFASNVGAIFEMNKKKIDPTFTMAKASDKQKKEFADYLDTIMESWNSVSQDVKDAVKGETLYTFWKIKFVIQPETDFLKEGTQAQLDLMKSNPTAYGFYAGNMARYFKGEGSFYTLDQVNKWFGDIKPSNAREGAEKLYKRKTEIEENLEYLQGLTEQTEEVKKEIENLNEEEKAINAYGEDQGIDWSQFDKKKNRTGGGSSADKEAQDLRNRMRILREAANSYKYWREKVGDKGAEAHVMDEFGQTMGSLGYNFENIEQFKKTLDELRDKYQQIYDASSQKGYQRPQLLEAIKEIEKALSELNRNEFEKASSDFLSRIQIEMDNLAKTWDVFNQIRESTGDVELSVNIAGVKGGTRNLADALKEKINQDIKDFGFQDVDFNMNLSDEQIHDVVEQAIPRDEGKSLMEYESKIEGLVAEYKKWRDLQRDVVKNDISTFAQLLGGAKDYTTQVRKIEDTLERQRESIEALQKPDSYSDEEWKSWKKRALAIAEATAEAEKFKLSTDYVNLMNHSLSMTVDSIGQAAEAVQDNLNRQLEDGVISAEEYAEQMEKVHKIVRDKNLKSFFGSGAMGEFMSGGVNGAIGWFDDAIAKRRGELARSGVTDSNLQNQDSELSKLLESRGKWEGVQKAMSDITSVIDIATGALSGMVDAAKSLSDMFAALGNESASNTWSDISDTISGISSVLTPVDNVLKNATSGNISGLVSSAISAPVQMITGPITAFAQLYDKQQQRTIDTLRDEIEAIRENTEAIRRSRERTLGYDDGEERRRMGRLYKDTSTKNIFASALMGEDISMQSAARKAMQDYYNKNSEGDGYSQEFKNLTEERAKYLKMYDEEHDKKDESKDALDEYKQKIAELDDQIMFFTEDLANELWGLDLKGWADQFGDALMTAFENGEDAAEAFDETASEIMRNLVKNMATQFILEPMFEQLRTKLFGTPDENGIRQGGAFRRNANGTINFAESQEEVAKAIAEALGPDGYIKEGYDDAMKMIEQFNGYGIELRNQESDSSSSGSGGIKSITEETAALLMSYVNAIRADVSVDRALLAQYIPGIFQQVTSANSHLGDIRQRAEQIARSNDAIERNTAHVSDLMDGLRNKTWRIPMA